MKISNSIRSSTGKIGACDEFGIQLIEVIEDCFPTCVSNSEMLNLLSNRSALLKLHGNAQGEVKSRLAEFLNYDEAWFELMTAYPLVAVAKLNQTKRLAGLQDTHNDT